jgi:hypothetical protein
MVVSARGSSQGREKMLGRRGPAPSVAGRRGRDPAAAGRGQAPMEAEMRDLAVDQEAVAAPSPSSLLVLPQLVGPLPTAPASNLPGGCGTQS